MWVFRLGKSLEKSGHFVEDFLLLFDDKFLWLYDVLALPCSSFLWLNESGNEPIHFEEGLISFWMLFPIFMNMIYSYNVYIYIIFICRHPCFMSLVSHPIHFLSYSLKWCTIIQIPLRMSRKRCHLLRRRLDGWIYVPGIPLGSCPLEPILSLQSRDIV